MHDEHNFPKKGNEYFCTMCGMRIKVIEDCEQTTQEQASFRCCGFDMQKDTPKS